MPVLSLLAASLIVPQPDERFMRKVIGNFPAAAQMRNESGAVLVRYWVEPDGKVYRCEPLQVFDGEIFRPAVCKSVIGLRFGRAAGAGGSATYGMLTQTVIYAIQGGRYGPRSRSNPKHADFTLEVPGAAISSTDIRIAVHVQPDGSVTTCEGLDGAEETLAEHACTEARSRGAPVGTDPGGSPISYVTALVARFEAAAS